MAEGLRKINGDLADLKLLPDADVQFILELEKQIVMYLRQPHEAAARSASEFLGGAGQPPAGPPAGPPPGMDPGGMGPAAMMQAGMGAPGPGAPGVAGVSQRRLPSPDEMRRVLAGPPA
jgi:hypothetical protein